MQTFLHIDEQPNGVLCRKNLWRHGIPIQAPNVVVGGAFPKVKYSFPWTKEVVNIEAGVKADNKAFTKWLARTRTAHVGCVLVTRDL